MRDEVVVKNERRPGDAAVSVLGGAVLVSQHEANAPHGLQQLLAGRRRQLAAQVPDVHVDDVALGIEVHVPHFFEQVASRDRPTGYHGSTYYESLDDPDLLIDIADWESPEARTAHLEKAMAAGTYADVLELLAGPFRATVIRALV